MIGKTGLCGLSRDGEAVTEVWMGLGHCKMLGCYPNGDGIKKRLPAREDPNSSPSRGQRATVASPFVLFPPKGCVANGHLLFWGSNELGILISL